MSVPYTFATTNDSLTACTGLLVLVQLMDRLDLSACIDRHFPQPGSNRSLRASIYVRTFILTLHTGEFRRDNEALLPMLVTLPKRTR